MSDKTILTAGGSDLPEPIRVQLMPMYKAVQYDFFKHLKKPLLLGCDFAQSIEEKSKNVERILKEYPNLKGAKFPEGKISHKLKVRKEGKICDPVNISRSLLPQSHRPGNRHLCQTFFFFFNIVKNVVDVGQSNTSLIVIKGRSKVLANINGLDSNKVS